MLFENHLLASAAVILLASAAFSSMVLLFSRKLRDGSGISGGALFLKTLTVAFLLLALAGPYAETSSRSSQVLALIDVSESMDESISESLLKKAAGFVPAGVEVKVLPFSGDTATFPVEASSSWKKLKDSWGRLNQGATNLETAFRTAASQKPASVILLSDGQESEGDSEKSLPLLSALKVPVFPLLPSEGQQKPKQFRISSLSAPLVVAAKKSAEVRVSILNSTDSVQKGLLKVYHDKKEILSQTVSIDAGKELAFITDSDPEQEGIREITARLIPEDASNSESIERIFLSSEPRERVLLVSGQEEDERLLKPLLTGQAYQLNALVTGAHLGEFPDLSQYSSLIINNASLLQLPSGSAKEIERFVSKGGGFIMVGGNRSFGLGGYIGSPIADILPVEPVPPKAEQKRLNLAVELVIDKSRSMADNQKLDYSKEAAKEVIRLLKDEDYIGVIGFDMAPFEVVRLDQVGKIREHAKERIGRLYPDRATNLYPSMLEAQRRLEGVQAGRKHMIILTDGKIPDANQSYVESVKQMRYLGISVSTVMIGSEYDFGFLQSLAEFGGGAYYQTDNPFNLPSIFIQDMKVQGGEKTMKEQEEFPVRPGPAGAQSTTIAEFPALKGFVETKPKEKAALELVISSQGKPFPLLSSWKYGLGKSLAFTSDANGRWSAFWANSTRFARFWTEILDSLRPEKGQQEGKIKFDLRPSVDRGELNLDLSIFNDIPGSSVKAQLLSPDGTGREMVFRQLGRGHFQAAAQKARAGKYELRAEIGGQRLTPVAFYLSGELFGEKKGKGFNVQNLEAIASATGGKTNPSREEIPLKPVVQKEKTDLSHYFLLLALIVLCLDVVRREVWWRYGLRKSRAVS